MRPLPRSLRSRLLVLVIGVVGLVWAVTAATTWLDVRHELDELLDSHLAQAAALLVVQQARDVDDGRGVDAPTLHRYAPKVAFQVFHEGRLALRSANAPTAPMLDPAQRVEGGFATVPIAGASWRVFATRGAERDVLVYVGEQTRSRTAILWAVLRGTLWPVLVALPLLALAAGWAVHRGTAPLRQLGRTLTQRSADSLDPVRLDDAPSEMVPMVDALNGLFERIAALMASERRFTADAAHELRTPIAAIRAQAQVAQGASDDAQRRHALQATLAGCDRAGHLVEQLLTLSRLEGGATPALHRVDLAALAQRVLGELAPKAIAKHQQLTLDAAPDSIVMGDETLLAALVRNLVDNAVRYGGPSARVEVTLRREGDTVLLGVDDSGPGLSDADLRRLGERFFRVTGSEESGSGLGWSIAGRIAAVHGAPLQAQRCTRLGGLAVQLAFPAPPGSPGSRAADDRH
ncbi:MAG: sensor histidine kinase N-terminal domain-containing protein [Burkholderiales bacterium]|nr:sensor histidine kinase N-terminal domain-containing protein [Burkholderiales bacterium]